MNAKGIIEWGRGNMVSWESGSINIIDWGAGKSSAWGARESSTGPIRRTKSQSVTTYNPDDSHGFSTRQLRQLRKLAHYVSVQLPDGWHMQQDVAYVEYAMIAGHSDQGSCSEEEIVVLPNTLKEAMISPEADWWKQPPARR